MASHAGIRLTRSGVLLVGLLCGLAPQVLAGKDCANVSVELSPLTELGTARYQGVRGGLYPEGRNDRPKNHEQAGREMARTVVPLNEAGSPDPRTGRIVLLASGMSNAEMEFNAFKKLARQRGEINPKLKLVNGAMGQASAEVWADPEGPWWDHVQGRLTKAGVSPQQVQVAWLKHVRSRPGEPFPQDAVALKRDLIRIVRLLKQRFPNLKLAYLSSRSYAGYATGSMSPEPFAYHSGFAVKWVIEEQIRGNRELNYDPKKGPVQAPWLAWGPYLWADGLTKRRDGLIWHCGDFIDDGVHPSDVGKHKVAQLLWQFFTTDPTAKSWFLASPGPR